MPAGNHDLQRDERSTAQHMLLEALKSFPHVTIVTRLRDGLIVDVNDTFERLTGYSRDEVVGTTTLRMWDHPLERQRFVRLASEQGNLSNYECRAVIKSGELRYCQVSAQILELNGEPHAISVVQDVTELRELQREILRNTDNERHQLASELHDGLAQDLAGVSYLMRSIENALDEDPGETRAQLRQLRDVIEGTIEKTRAMARGFSPIEMAQGGLAVALYRLRLDIATIYGIEVKLEFQASIHLSDIASRGVYAIIHEAVINAAKHSGCRQIDVGLGLRDGLLQVSVRDDGHGIIKAGQHDGLGIQLMKYRAALLCGNVDIVSSPDQGTLVRCSLDPLSAREPGHESAQMTPATRV